MNLDTENQVLPWNASLLLDAFFYTLSYILFQHSTAVFRKKQQLSNKVTCQSTYHDNFTLTLIDVPNSLQVCRSKVQYIIP